MQPAFSIVLFNVTMGLGFGWIAVALSLHESTLAPFHSSAQIMALGILGLVAISIGLVFSVGHLANPKNFWRAFIRVRTSWLSREAVLAALFYPIVVAYLWLNQGPESGFVLSHMLGGLCIVVALLTLFSTGMIYACLRTIRQWYTPLTPINYVLMSLALGAIAAAVQHALAADGEAVWVSQLAFVLLLGTAIGKLCYYLQIGLPAAASIEVATGFRMASVRLLDMGQSPRSFLTDEFDFKISRTRLLLLRLTGLLIGFVGPGIILLGADSTPAWLFLALLLAYAGALVERWLFFAEAQHVVRLYHGHPRT